MLKPFLLATAMTFAVPALAQEASTPQQAAPMQARPATSQDQPMTASPDTAMDQTTTPTDQAMPQSAEAAPAAATGDQVADVVTKEFPTYDKDANGALSKVEFAAWMNTLKAADPAAAKTAADPKWTDAAFAQADTDKSKSVSQVELTGFLSAASKAS